MNIPLLTSLCAGDIIVAEDDGVVVVPATDIADTLAAAEKRQASEDEKRQKLASDELGADLYECVQRLKRLDYAMSRNLRTSELKGGANASENRFRYGGNGRVARFTARRPALSGF
jgi:hypothetical protein